jgi:hypothetical protein
MPTPPFQPMPKMPKIPKEKPMKTLPKKKTETPKEPRNTALEETKVLGSFLSKVGSKLKSFLGWWGEFSIGIPLMIAVLAGIGLLYAFVFQGRAPIDPPLEIWVYAQKFVALILAAIFTGITQQFLFGYRSKEAGHEFRDDVYDAAVTAFLLVLACVVFLVNA